MNTKLSSIALALIATSASAFAADPTLTRAQVRAEVEQAYARGELNRQSEFVEHAGTSTGKSRAAVRAEFQQAYAHGQVGNQSEFVEHASIAAGKSGDEAREEAIRAAESARVKSTSGS
jgi:hypothetical protein